MAELSSNSPRRGSIMSSPAAEPPPKKQKLANAQDLSPLSTSASARPPSPAVPPPETLGSGAPSTAFPPPTETASLSSEEEKLRKLRNREELRKVFERYSRIRKYIGQRKDGGLTPELEQDYLYLISASRGCESVQRFLALPIPRFALHCPTALEAATKVTINIYKCNMATVTRGEDSKGVAYQTARACIVGLTDICSAASSEAPKSSVITGICSAVYRTVLTFFISTFEGKDIYCMDYRKRSMLQDPLKLLETFKLELENSNQQNIDSLFELGAFCLLCTFLLFPENVLEACFTLLASAESDDAKGKGLCFLKQVTSSSANDVMDDKVDQHYSGMEGNLSGTNKIVYSNPTSDGNVVSENAMVGSNECYITMAISRHPPLRRWILSRYKKLCDSCKPAVVSEVSSCLKVLGSLSEPSEDKSHMDNESPVLEKCDTNFRENMRPDEKISPSEQIAHSKTERIEYYGDKSSRNKNVDTVYTNNKKSDRLGDAKLNDCIGVSVVSDVGHQGARSNLLMPKSVYDSAGGSTSLTSPGQHFGTAKLYEPFDIYGAHVTRDVISVSKELWVGSLGNRVAESSIRSKFEEFGPLANFLFCPSKDFSLVEYRNILHAVRACGYMQGSSIWGGFLQIRYLDRLIGSKGFIRGIAVGESRHIYVAKVKNQKDKDEIFDELKAAGLKRPCGVTDISGENALLLEFETAVDAATAKLYIRRQASPNVCSRDMNTPSHQLLVQNIDNSVPDIELIDAFSRFGEVVRWQFNRSDSNCIIVYRSQDAAACAKSQLHGARFGLKSVSVESRPCSAGSIHDKTVSPVAPLLGQSVPDNMHHEIRNPRVPGYHAGYTAPGDRPIYGPPSSNASRAPQGILPCPPVSSHRGPVIPPPPIQTSFARPVYPGPGSPWENTTPNPPPFSHASPRMMPGSNFRVNPAPLPFIPSSVTPIVQLPGGSTQHSEKMPPLPNAAPPPFTPLDMPPPPPLPISQPPSVPPPPNSPPPLQPSAEFSDSKKSSSHPRWEGTLLKSGLHYCRIYASRIELDACRYENSVSEPTEWPSTLDVTKRTDFQHVKTTFSNTPPSKREVCRFVPCSNGDQKGFRDFISYLIQRECAGVIRIPAVKAMWTRLLFILPPTSDACGMLALPPHPSDCMICVILPKETNAEAA